jgi:hypothetical protein
MEIKFADTFSKSLKKLMWHENKIYKFYSFFRRDIWRFLKNVWRFRKPLSSHYWWDHHGTLMFMEVGLTHMSENLEKKGMEIEISRMKKVEAMKRAVQIIKNYNEGNYIEMAESEVGSLYLHDWEFEEVPDKPGLTRLVEKNTEEVDKHNSKVFELSRKIEEKEWKELFKILKGQDYKNYKKFEKTLTEEEKKETDQYYKWFNGSGLKGWWD